MNVITKVGLQALTLIGLVGIGVATASAAAPANDNFANAAELVGYFGSATTDNTYATAEPFEPSHAGFVPTSTIWYKWTAPADGEVSFNTMGSVSIADYGFATRTNYLDTVVGVYTGAELRYLTQVAANDDYFPMSRYGREVDSSRNLTEIMQFGSGTNAMTRIFVDDMLYFLPFNGPSGLRFNATAGTTYYIALDTKYPSVSSPLDFATGGPVVLNWAYHPSGVFRFATEDVGMVYDSTSSGFGYEVFPLYQVAETESSGMVEVSMAGSYYNYLTRGLVVSITRVCGYSGRILVDYSTSDLLDGDARLGADRPAVGGLDYEPVVGTLVFDDFEMTKNILIPIYQGNGFSGGRMIDPDTNRLFAVNLSNPRVATNESPVIAPPSLDPFYSSTMVRILDVNTDAMFERNFNPDTNSPTGGFWGTTTNFVCAFGKRHYYIPEDITSGSTTVRLRVYRTGTNVTSPTIHYRINNWLGSDADDVEGDNNFFPLMAESDYAVPTPQDSVNVVGTNSDFALSQGTFTIPRNPGYSDITFTVTNDTRTEFAKDFQVTLYHIVEDAPVLLGNNTVCRITILFDDMDPPAGSVDEWHNADFSLEMKPPINTVPPEMSAPGSDGIVYALATQRDDKTIIAGAFGSYNAVVRNGIARMNLDGSVDPTFDPQGGIDTYSVIAAMALQSDGKIVIGGNFNSYNGSLRSCIARLDSFGAIDNTFDPGDGADDTIWSIALQSDGKVLVAGDFTMMQGYSRSHVARLNADGSLDTTFNPPVISGSVDATLNCVAVTATGQIMIGGKFSKVGTTTANNLARLNANGTVDATFANNLGLGMNLPVLCIAALSDGKVLVGGEFTKVNVTKRSRLVRLNVNGTVDTVFDPGSGTDDSVYDIRPQTDGTIYIGGLFTTYNGTHRLGFARLYSDGILDTTFLDTTYNQFAGLHRRFFDKQTPGDSRPFVACSSVQSDGAVMIGGSFRQVGGGQVNIGPRTDSEFPTNSYNQHVWYEPKSRDGVRNRNNVARLIGGATTGPGNVGLLYDSYSVNQQQGFLYVSLTRTNGDIGFLGANFTVEPGLAQMGADYTYGGSDPVYLNAWENGSPGTRGFGDGMFGTNSRPMDMYGHIWNYNRDGEVIISVYTNSTPGNRDSVLRLANPSVADQFFLGGANIPLGGALGRSAAPFVIINDNRDKGYIGFSTEDYYVSENGTNAVITVTRTNGAYGAATIVYETTVGGTAVVGTNYVYATGTLTFGMGVTNKSFNIPIIDDRVVQPGGLTVKLRLYSVNGAGPGLTNAVLHIVDNDYDPGYLSFSPAVYTTNESAGMVKVGISRIGSARGTLNVQFGTLDGTAVSGVKYTTVNTNLQWNNLDASPKWIQIPIIHDGLVGANTFFRTYLTNATVNGTNAPLVLQAQNSTATINLLDDDNYGHLQFSASSYLVNEDGGYATISVIRTDGAAETLSVNYSTSDGTAYAGGPVPNYVATSGSLSFGPNEVSKSFRVPVLNDGLTDPAPADFYFNVNLSGLFPSGARFGYQTNATVHIVDVKSFNQPAGSLDTTFVPSPGFNGDVLCLSLQGDGKIVAGGSFTSANNAPRYRIARLNADSSVDDTFMVGLSGLNAAVNSILVQGDGRIVVGGVFTTANGVSRNRIARFMPNGSLDSSFSAGGSDSPVFALAETFPAGLTNRNLLVGGSFLTMNGSPRPSLARLTERGALDGSFNTNLTINGTVYAIAVYPTNTIQAGKILIGGDFTLVEGQSRNGLARLTPDGALDVAFNPGAGATNPVRALAIQLDGRVLVGGSFTNFDGHVLNHIARLNVDGSVDTDFNAGVGANDTVNSIALQPDTRIVLAGQFTRANNVTRNHITRLLPDGSVDPAINFGLGADGVVNSVLIQPQDGMFVIGGGFTTYDGQPRPRIARIYGGALAGSGLFTFTAPDFQADETATNAYVTIRRVGGTAGEISANLSITDNTAVAGVNYTNVSGPVVFPEGETFQTVSIPVMEDKLITADLVADLTLDAAAPAGVGDQPFATLTIVNNDSGVSFSLADYQVYQNLFGGNAFVTILRQGSVRGTASVGFYTTTNGTAIAGTDFTMVSNTVTFAPGVASQSVAIPILNNSAMYGNRTVAMQLTNAVNSLLFNPSEATLTILSTNQSAGEFFFSQTNYVVSEGAGVAALTVVRTNGRSGVVSLRFATANGTALAGLKYVATNGTLTFADGEMSKTLLVTVLETTMAEGDQTFSVTLSIPTGGRGTILAPSTVPVTILDNDPSVGFLSSIYQPTETAGTVTLAVQRIVTNGVTTVQYATTNGTAKAGVNYVPANGSLTFSPGESLKTFTLSLLHDPRVTGDLAFGVNLFNANPVSQYFPYQTATVVVFDADPGVSFSSTNVVAITNEDLSVTTYANYGVLKSGTNVVISVVRSNANTGIVSVNYATTNNTAVAGVDYVATSGLLTFSNGVALQSFSVPIIKNTLIQGDLTFDILLFTNALSGGVQLLEPYKATVTITNDIAGLSFSEAVYRVNENGVAATIDIVRSGYTNSLVTVDYATADGTAQDRVNYFATNNTVTFTNGETRKSFQVKVFDNSIVDGDQTVLLSLANVTGNGGLVNPSASTLIIVESDGSLVVPAGTALTSESGPVNGVIDPGEDVSLLFGLRNITGTNTTQLVATLLPGNGISNPSGPQEYGQLILHGPAASRPFSFRANGTNGQVISAVFQLRDGATVLSNAVFNFALGQSSMAFSNNAAIVIKDNSGANPYPSAITVGGVGNMVSKTTVTLSNLNHTWPKDINALLVSPMGQKSYLLSKAGAGLTVSNVTLTFDDAAASKLAQAARLTSGTNQPTCYAVAPPPFPVPAPPSTAAAPYTTNLSVFNGYDPNGTWLLYIYDDTQPNVGIISNGWTLRLTTLAPVTVSADVGLSMTASQATNVATSNLTYTLTVKNYGPGGATNVVVTNTLPGGTAFVGTDRPGQVSVQGGQVIWSVGTLARDASIALALVVQPNTAGLITNTAVVGSSTSDPNPDDDTATMVSVIALPQADLLLGMTGPTEPVSISSASFSYQITVRNLGKATAPDVRVTDVLPVGLTLLSATPTGYVQVGNVVTFTNLGNLGDGQSASVVLVLRPDAEGTFTNTASTASGVTDPLKANNIAAVKTVVSPEPFVSPAVLTLSYSATELTMSWLNDSANYELETAPSLEPSVVWTPVGISPIIEGARRTVVLPIGPGAAYYRLRGQVP